jgi:hypothetical protein
MSELTYEQRVLQAYRELVIERQGPDVPIHCLHRRVGGDFDRLQAYLRQACLEQRAVPSSGEPSVVGAAARQSALHLPGEKESFLLIRLLEPQPAMTQEQQLPQQHPTITLTLTPGQADLVAEALHYGANELAQYDDGHGRDADGVETPGDYLADLQKGLLEFVKDPKAHAGQWGVAAELRRELDQATETLQRQELQIDRLERDLASAQNDLRVDRVLQQAQGRQQPQRPEHERYESLLRATAALRYPKEERTPELEAKIEKTIQRKVSDYLQEQQYRERVRLYEASLRRQLDEKRPQLSAERIQHYEGKIQAMVAQFRQNPAQQQQGPQSQPHRRPERSRQQGQGRGLEQSL